MHVRTVLHHGQSAITRKRSQGRHVRKPHREMNRHNCSRAISHRDLRDIQAICIGINIGKHWNRTGIEHRSRGAVPRVRRNDDFNALRVFAHIAHRLKREQKVVDALSRKSAATIDELVAVAYDDVSPKLHPVAKRSLHAHLIKLGREGRAREDGERWALA